MTCIVGIEHADGVTIGADSAGSNLWSTSRRGDSKLFTIGPYLIGFCGSFRMGQLLRYSLEVPEPPTRSLDRFMATDFIDCARRCFKKGGFAEKQSGVESAQDSSFLVGVNGHLFTVECDYQVGSQIAGYDAIGSGGLFAMGSLHTTETLGFSPLKRARLALDAAAEHDPFVSAPFKVRTIRP